MLSGSRHTSQSPSESAKTDSVMTGPTTRLTSLRSQRSSITEEDESESVAPPPPPPPPLNPFLSGSAIKAKASSRSSKASSTSSSSTPKPVIGAGTSTKRTGNTSGFQRTALRSSSDEKNSSAQQKSNKQSVLQKVFVKGSAIQSAGNDKSSAGFSPQHGNSKLSIFEKVDRHNGHATYLGTGTFLQLENCIRNCLSQERSHGNLHDYPTTSSSHHKSIQRASVLEDYSYEGIIAPHEQINISTDHHHHRHLIKHAAELPLDEIRQVNDALAKYGIPIFSHLDQSHSFQNQPRPVGEILSACQQLLADPLLQSQRSHAVQNVWDNLHSHSPQTNIHGYASPAVKGVVSHLFGSPNQAPYDPVHSVASQLFHTQPQNTFYSPPPPPPGPFGGGLQQNYYNPPPPPPPGPYGGDPQQNYFNPPPPPPPSGPTGAGQSVLSRLFGR